MRLGTIAVFVTLSLSCNAVKCMAFGQDMEGPPELRDALKCEIRLTTNNGAIGSRILGFLTLSNTAPIYLQLPCPGTLVGGLHVRMFLLTTRETGPVQRLSVPLFVFQGNPTAEQSKMLARSTDWWSHIYMPPRWIDIPPGGKEKFQVLVEMSPNADSSGDARLSPGTYRLQCEIEFVMHSYSTG